MTYAVPTYLPAYAGTALLSLACSRRVPALRPVAACFGAWSLLDAVTGPLWLRAGVLVAWPGAALVAGAWGLGPVCAIRVAEVGALRGRDSRDRSIASGARLSGDERGSERDRVGRSGRGAQEVDEVERSGGVARKDHRLMVATAITAVYLLAGCAAALPYALGHLAPYHLALPISRALAVTLCTLAVLRPLPRTWAARACVAPAVGLACGVVAGVWTLLPAGMGAVREAWGRLAGAETWVTLGVTAGCVVAAWWEARRRR